MLHQYHRGIFEGVNISRDNTAQLCKIFEWMKQQADTGNPDAQLNLGVMHAYGLGTETDAVAAIECFQRTADQDHPLGIYNCGIACFDGRAVQFDPDLAVKHFKRGADENHTLSILALAQCHREPMRYRYDKEIAFKLYKQAAKLDDREGLYQLGICYLNSFGVTRNLRKSISLLEDAARMNHPMAQIRLRNFYIEKNPDRKSKNRLPNIATDQQMAIIWNYVFYTTQGYALDTTMHYFLPHAAQMGLVYPECIYPCGIQRIWNGIIEAIQEQRAEDLEQFHRDREWALESGITELYLEIHQTPPTGTKP